MIAPDVGGIHWSEFSRIDEAMAAGRTAAERARHRMRALAVRTPAPERAAGGP